MIVITINAETLIFFFYFYVFFALAHSASHLKLICEALGAICSSFTTNYEANQLLNVRESKHPFDAILLPILKKLESYIELPTLDRNDTTIVELLASICLQAVLGSFMPHRLMKAFHNLLRICNYWTQYRIARSASRYVHRLGKCK